MVSSRLSPNTDSKPGVGEKLALIAMVVVLSKIWPQRKCGLAANGGPLWGCRRHSRVLSCAGDDRLEADVQPVWKLCGDSLKIFCTCYYATTAVAADNCLTVYADPTDRSRFLEGLRKAGLKN